MLIEFNIGNFLSFKDDTTLSMVAVKSYKEHKDTNLIDTHTGLTLLKSAIVYGNNASGKSNLLEGIGFMRQTVLNSLRNALLDQDRLQFPLP